MKDRIQNKSTRQIGVVLEIVADKGLCLVALLEKDSKGREDQVYWEIKDTRKRRLMILEASL